MRRNIIFTLLIALCILTLSACGCKHETWNDADCVTPKTCAECGETEGAPLGHSWLAATCETAKTCEVCGEVDGEALGHSWVEATCTDPKTCTTCALTDGEALGHTWEEATTETPKTCTTCAQTEGERIITDARFTTAATLDVQGTWICRIDVDGAMMGIADFEGVLPFNIVMELGNDGTLNLTMEIADVELFNQAMKKYMMDMMYAEFTASGLSAADADEAMKEAYGMTVEEYVDYALSEIDYDSMFEDYSMTGVYYVEDNTLYTADSWEDEMTSNGLTLEGDSMTIENMGTELGYAEGDLSFTKVTE